MTALARYRLNGTLDPTFSEDGKTTTSFVADSVAWGVTVDADSRIVTSGDTTYEWALARFAGDGTLDQTFSEDGRAMTNLTDGIDRSLAVATQTNGRIVAVGTAGEDMAIAGYTG